MSQTAEFLAGRSLPTGKEILIRSDVRFGNPVGIGNPGRYGDLELHRAVGLLLHCDGTGAIRLPWTISRRATPPGRTSELAVDREVEGRRLLADQLALVPRDRTSDSLDCRIYDWLLCQ